MIIYGRNAVHEAMRANRRRIKELWATDSASREDWLDRASQIKRVSAAEIDKICESPGNQGVCARIEGYHYVSAAELLAKPDPLIIALDEVQDPQNLGAICRTAECIGATGVIITERRAAPVTPAVCKASAGAVEWLSIAKVNNLSEFLEDAKKAGAWCYGADSGDEATDYLTPDYRGGVVLVLGSEGSGLRPRVASCCDALIKLPMLGQLDSLNASAAASALMYGILQQRS